MRRLTGPELDRQMLEWLSGRRVAAPFGLLFECGTAVDEKIAELSRPASQEREPEWWEPEWWESPPPPFNAAFTGIPVRVDAATAPDAWTLLYLDGIFLAGKLSDGPIPLEKAFWEARNG